MVAILDMSDMWVTFNIKETLMPKIRMGKRLRKICSDEKYWGRM